MFDQNDVQDLTGATAYDANGDKIGSIGQVYLDDDNGQPSWVTVSTGWFGTSETFVPLEGASRDADGNLRLAYGKDQVKDAPRVDADQHLDRDQEAELYRYYQMGYDRDGVVGDDLGRDRDAAVGTAGLVDRERDLDVDRDRAGLVDGDTDRDAMSVTASEERLRVGKEEVETGRLRLRKYVTTEEETVTVPVSREVLEVERVPVDGDRVQAGEIVDQGEQVEEITLREERVVVGKETVATEQVNVRKGVETEEQTVSEQVRKEHIDVDGDGDGIDRDGTRGDRI